MIVDGKRLCILRCAALEYRQMMSGGAEVVICAAIRMPDGYIVRGHRHCHCIDIAYSIPRYASAWECPFGDDQGFVTSRNRYVTREEGLALQHAAGIPSADPSGYRARELFSEDLY